MPSWVGDGPEGAAVVLEATSAEDVEDFRNVVDVVIGFADDVVVGRGPVHSTQ